MTCPGQAKFESFWSEGQIKNQVFFRPGDGEATTLVSSEGL